MVHLPSAKFAANAAWLALAGIAYNLGRWCAALAGGRATATTATLRRKLFAIPARLVHSARRLHLRLPSELALAADHHRPARSDRRHHPRTDLNQPQPLTATTRGTRRSRQTGRTSAPTLRPGHQHKINSREAARRSLIGGSGSSQTHLTSFFGFTRTPFRRDPAPSMLHRHAGYAGAVARIRRCISENGHRSRWAGRNEWRPQRYRALGVCSRSHDRSAWSRRRMSASRSNSPVVLVSTRVYGRPCRRVRCWTGSSCASMRACT